jgi:phospholipid N-methyltransferase
MNMKATLKMQALKLANRVFQPFNVELVPSMRADRPVEEYIPYPRTAAAARKAGMSIPQYVDSALAGSGTTAETIYELASSGAIDASQKRICEIGPGSGRYLEKVLAVCQPDHYEIYETAEDWRKHLVATYPVTAQPCDGRTLGATPDESMDLVHAHRVFNTIPLTITLGYMFEIMRITREGGKVVFDIFSSECLDEDTARKWVASGALFPKFLDKQYVVGLFSQKGFVLLDNFFIPLQQGRTEYLVFEKTHLE